MKQAKFQRLQDLSEINGDNLNNVRHEASRHFKNKMKGYLKDRVDELAMNSKDKENRNLYTGINTFRNGYQPRNNVVDQENVDLLAASHNILKIECIIPFYKKSDKIECSNYPKISLL
jgi:hypothetical protein